MQVERIWREYLVFAFTRSPFTRALSTYKFLARKVRAEDPGACLRYTWDSYCLDPMSLGRLCM